MLTQNERAKFADYLDHQVETDKVMILQMEKMSNMEAMIKKLRVECMASTVVSTKLRSTELF